MLLILVSNRSASAATAPLALKLELLQHGGSFKARGAFANLLTRTVPRQESWRLRAGIMAWRFPMRR